MKKYCFLLLCSLLLLGACRKKGIEAAEEPQRFDTEEPILSEETGESAGRKETLAAALSDSQSSSTEHGISSQDQKRRDSKSRKSGKEKPRQDQRQKHNGKNYFY